MIEIVMIFILIILIFFIYHKYVSLKENIQTEARKIFENWRKSELLTLQAQYESQLNEAIKRNEAALEEKYKGLFLQWCQNKEAEIRQDAVARSQSVILGRVSEHIAPYLPEFEFNPRDARFIGNPIDFIVFNGLSDGVLKSIVFVEVKSGDSQLTPRERAIRDIISKGFIEWREFRIQTIKDQKKQENDKQRL